MSIQTETPEIQVQRTNYPENMEYQCPICNEIVAFEFSSAKHDYTGFTGHFREFRYQYICSNLECEMHDVRFNPAPLNVIPRKRYSLAIWKWVAEESKIYKQKPGQIAFRANMKFGVPISETTVRSYLKEIDAFISGKIDARTYKLVRAQGQILLAFDGQEPDGKGPALWLFVDVLSNRVLHVELLDSANHVILHEIIAWILGEYGVKMIGMISDKQGCIVTCHDKYYPNIPHQYCHFHFLANMWNHLEMMDGQIHKAISKEIKDLYIISTQKTTTKILENGEKKPIREIFKDIERDLRKLLRNHSTKFDNLRGIETYNNIENYINKITQECQEKDPSRWIVKTLLKAVAKVRKQLDTVRPILNDCIVLEHQFQEVRALLGDPNLARVEKILILDGLFQSIWDDASIRQDIKNKEDLRSFLPRKSTTTDELLLEWVRLYNSYRRGLFAYYDFPLPERTNIAMEKKFSEEKMQLFTQCGKKRVGAQVRIRGEHILKELYAGKEEVEEIIAGIDVETSFEQVKAGVEARAGRTERETAEWRSRVDGSKTIKQTLEEGDQSTSSRKPRQKRSQS